MSLADQIRKIYAERDNASVRAAEARIEKLSSLASEWEAFQEEHNKTFERMVAEFQERHVGIEREEIEATTKAHDDADAKVSTLADEAMKASITPNDVKVREDAPTLTAQQIANTYKSADLKNEARSRGLSLSGNEITVAQRLLDSGWKP